LKPWPGRPLKKCRSIRICKMELSGLAARVVGALATHVLSNSRANESVKIIGTEHPHGTRCRVHCSGTQHHKRHPTLLAPQELQARTFKLEDGQDVVRTRRWATTCCWSQSTQALEVGSYGTAHIPITPTPW
jgi:hypothetical protein